MATSTLGVQLDRLRRRWWVVAVVLLLFLTAGIISAVRADTTYSSRATLAVVSQTRAPEQDAMLAHGYTDFFNQPENQSILRQIADVPDNVTLTAVVAAPSPLIYITASSSSSGDVESAAADAAVALRDTVNDALRASRADAIAEVRRPLDDIRETNGVVPQQALIQMEDRISQINADTTNQIEIIELQSSVSSSKPNLGTTLGLAVLAGLVVGCGFALAWGALSRRVGSGPELELRTGIEVLGQLPPDHDVDDDPRFGQLANAITGLDKYPRSLVMAAPRERPAVESTVGRIATELTDTGLRVVVVDHARASEPGAGAWSAVTVETIRPDSDITSSRPVNRYHLRELLDSLTERADLVLITAPPLVESATAQSICAEADGTLLVAEESVTALADVRTAQRLCRQAGGDILGAVLIETPRRTIRSGRLSTLVQRRHASPENASESATDSGAGHEAPATPPAVGSAVDHGTAKTR
ncbi:MULTISPECIES: hypothetical protein [Gordonia]|uniref:Capsular polysaccharide biosynthesis protein n=1 Tax=Gordonia tangerina TaxID=2911060 RepID=A0ABS9DLV1_9ACTN|nr:hypothetical protein [Gordonia tangerina]MCF3940142.1 hypothetical protein [Gordonia tangerina]